MKKSNMFAFEKMSHADMNPIVGGSSSSSSSTTGRNQTTSSGADNDSKQGDQDNDVIDILDPGYPECPPLIRG